MMNSLLQILDLFPAHTHPLTLVSDPDGLLAGEAALVELAARGFKIIREPDPVLLRLQVEQARPFSPERPLLIITPGVLEDLPFDLWQPAHRIKLSLHAYFPNLAYPVLRTLSPSHLERLLALRPPDGRMSRRGSVDYLLRHVFDFYPEQVNQPHGLIAWLIHLHEQLFPLPLPLEERVLEILSACPPYASWEVAELIRSRTALAGFLQREWNGYVHQTAQHSVGEDRISADDGIPDDDGISEDAGIFRDEGLQNLLPQLVRQGLLAPVRVEGTAQSPVWAWAGIEAPGDEHSQTEAVFSQLLAEISDPFSGFNSPDRWEHWQKVAAAWAELNRVRFDLGHPLDADSGEKVKTLAATLDQRFQSWLPAHYGALATQRLPVPRQVHHIPHNLAHLKEQGKAQRVALVILDGMSLCDWRVIGRAWQGRHRDWAFDETLLLAQVPTITSISRRALVSGLPPAGFAADLDHLPAEKSLWESFWSRAGLPVGSFYYSTIALDRQEAPAEVDSARLAAVCLVDDTIDKLVHHAGLGAAGQHAALRLWLTQDRELSSQPLEALLERLLRNGYTVFLASDHGHVQAQGFGAPSEGILAHTRGKRARLYRDPQAARRTQEQFPATLLWMEDGLLPSGLVALMPARRDAFTIPGEVVETHGGVSLDEMVVPFVKLVKT